MRPLRRQHVPHAVTDDKALSDGTTERFSGCEEQVRVGFCIRDVVTRDHGDSGRQLEQAERRIGGNVAAAGRYRPWDSELGEHIEQSLSPWERGHGTAPALIRLCVQGPYAAGLRPADVPPPL